MERLEIVDWASVKGVSPLEPVTPYWIIPDTVIAPPSPTIVFNGVANGGRAGVSLDELVSDEYRAHGLDRYGPVPGGLSGALYEVRILTNGGPLYNDVGMAADGGHIDQSETTTAPNAPVTPFTATHPAQLHGEHKMNGHAADVSVDAIITPAEITLSDGGKTRLGFTDVSADDTNQNPATTNQESGDIAKTRQEIAGVIASNGHVDEPLHATTAVAVNPHIRPSKRRPDHPSQSFRKRARRLRH